MDGQCLSYIDAIDAFENDDLPTHLVIFTKALRTNKRMDQQTDVPTDQRTDIPSYRDAIAASKKQTFFFLFSNI